MDGWMDGWVKATVETGWRSAA